MSCLTQARGLKYRAQYVMTERAVVVPHAGTWIEIYPDYGRL